jgi:uncharacterized membrane-anchored protein
MKKILILMAALLVCGSCFSADWRDRKASEFADAYVQKFGLNEAQHQAVMAIEKKRILALADAKASGELDSRSSEIYKEQVKELVTITGISREEISAFTKEYRMKTNIVPGS